MVHAHPSTPEQRAQWTAMMLAHQGEYGLVTHLSRENRVSRPTLYAWRDQAQQALRTAFSPDLLPSATARPTARQVLTLFLAHASARGIQATLPELLHQGLSLATISAVLAEAQQRALAWMQTHAPPTVRALALSEISANDRHGAYLHVVDVHSGAVWASFGPLAVDTESWTLVLWSLQDRGLRWNRVVGDDGAALQAACHAVTPQVPFQADHWHVLHGCAQLQARLDRRLRQLEAQITVVERQAARLAAGGRPLGRRPKTDVAAHAQDVAAARHLADSVRYLTQEVRRLLDVVVLDERIVLDMAERQADLDASLALLAEVAESAPTPQQGEVQRLQARLQAALPQLLTFAAAVAQLQQHMKPVLGRERQALLAWAWLRRHRLGWTSRAMVAAIPTDWHSAARVLLASWDDAVRVSSAVERWHSMVRPHLSVHRTLTSGMLALLAVWHNHRVFRRGVHKGKNPLYLSGVTDAPTDWLVALGYPPAQEAVPPAAAPAALALAA